MGLIRLSLSTDDSELKQFLVLEQLPSFRHRVFKVEDEQSGQPLFLKQYIDRASYNQELLTLEKIGKRPLCFAVPEVVYRDSENLWLALSEVVGQPIQCGSIDSKCIHHLTIALRQFHNSLSLEGLKKVNLTEDLNLYRKNILSSSHIAETDKLYLRRILDSVTEYFESRQGPVTVIHGDVNANNVLYDVDQQRIGIIDFEHAKSGYPCIDLSKLSWRILGNREKDVKEMMNSYFGEEYDESMDRDLQQSKLYNLLGTVSFYAWQGYRTGFKYHIFALEELKKC